MSEQKKQKIEISVTHVGGLRGQVHFYIDDKHAGVTIVPVAILDDIQKFAEFIQNSVNNQ